VLEHREQTTITSFADILPPVERTLYLLSASTNLRLHYEQQLREVRRWKNWDRTRTDPHFTENDWEHTRDMLVFINEIEQRFGTIAHEVSLGYVRLQTILHDGGEIITGDISPIGSGQKMLARKQKEADMMRKFILPHVQQETALLAQSLYNKYDHKNTPPFHIESLFTSFIDKIDGSKKGCEHLWNYAGVPHEHIPEEILAHTKKGILLPLKPAVPLYNLLSPCARVELDTMVFEYLELYENAGFGIEAINTFNLWIDQTSQYNYLTSAL
jgi:hypothetical protein